MAEGLRKIAKALYKRKSGEEEKEVVEFLSKLDFVLGEVSVQEFKKKECVESPNEELLKELCSKRDGNNLDFFDVLVVFYHSKKAITILRCDACRLLIFGPSFSCSDCFSSNCSSHTLCCDCYGGGEAILHDHPAVHFFHDQRLLGLRLNPAKVSSQGQNRKGGEGGMSSVARAYYERSSDDEKKKAREFFGTIDANGDGNISLAELRNIFDMKTSVIEKLFQALDSDGDGALNFVEGLALYYSCKSIIGYVTCDGCKEPILGPYFSCTLCVHRHPRTFDLCCDCYRGGKVEHEHPYSDFLHNQVLLSRLMGTQTKKERESGISSVARAYYERSSDDEKKKAREFFGKFDANGDGKISLTELIKNGSDIKTSTIEELFKALDSDGDGALNFVEGLVVYYCCTSKIGYMGCDGCKELILGPYFSCLVCVRRYPRTFDLCCDCHRGGKVVHEHPHSDFTSNQVLLVALMSIQAKGEMEEMREIARLHLEAATPSVARAALEFFDSMDSNGDKKVDVEEFMSFMSEQEECQQLRRNSNWFKFLDADGSGGLDFSEVMMLFYVINSGRPDCDGCSAFIPGTFFACLRCSYTLCRPCYKSKDHPHAHDGCTVPLLDNYSLLHNMRQSNRRQLGDGPPSSSRLTNELARSKMSKRDVAYKALLFSLDVTNIATQVASCVIS